MALALFLLHFLARGIACTIKKGTLIAMEDEKRTLHNALPGESTSSPLEELEALQVVIGALQPLGAEARARIYDSAGRFLRISAPSISPPQRGIQPRVSPLDSPSPTFSEDRSMSAKEFLLVKQPRTDVERMACLAFFLTHYRDTPHFKTLDLSKVNTEAAQPKFANAANAANNAVKRRYLVAATKGTRQLSATGEQFVQALPDRDAAKAAMASSRPRRAVRRSKSSRSSSESEEK